MATTSAGPWSVKGVDPRAREIAKDLARRSNMTLGEWLNHFIAESGGEPESPGYQAPLREPYAESASRRATASAKAPESATAAATDRGALLRITEALASLSARLDQSEAGAREALGSLHHSFADLETRLGAAEVRFSETDAGGVERRFEAYAAELAEKVEAGRTEIAERMREAAAGQFEKMEGALRDLSGHVEQTERRSAQAVERLGYEVLRVAQTLNNRVISAETRSAEGVERISGEMARVAQTVEGRMGESERLQAEALERLGSEISRIAERLADRIAGSERRSAAAIDDIGLQVTQAADRIDQRYEKATTDIADRIRQNEERTARLLEEARQRFDMKPAAGEHSSRFDESAQHFKVAETEEAQPVQDAPIERTAEPQALTAAFTAERTGVAGEVQEEADPEPEFEPIQDFGSAHADPFGPLPPLEPLSPFLDGPHSFEAHAEPATHAAHETGTAEELSATDAVAAVPTEPERPKTTRELLESARSAARLAAAGPPKSSSPVDSMANLSKRFNLSLPKLKRKDAGLTLRTAVVAAGTASAIAVTAVGAFKVYNGGAEQDQMARSSDRGAPMATMTPSAAPRHLRNGGDLDGVSDASSSTPMAAVALTPTVSTPAPSRGAPLPSAPPPAATDASSLFASGARRIEGGDKAGLSQIIRAASLGLPSAQFYLAKLYESGTGGTRKDLAQARRWTAKAAQAGDVKAMHNLGLYYFEGDGGEKNVAAAASWFKRAAELGLQDSQYNLARLYQQGYGVGQNGAEAYKWYLVAAANGDAGARNDALTLRKTLGADEAAAAERSAAQLQAQAHNAVTPTPPTL